MLLNAGLFFMTSYRLLGSYCVKRFQMFVQDLPPLLDVRLPHQCPKVFESNVSIFTAVCQFPVSLL